MERDKLPLPRFWYLPRGEKAVVVMSGDDHSPGQAPGGTASHFNRYKALSPAGCVVANWECVRSSSYVYPSATLTNAQAAGFVADGFEIGLHPLVASCPTTPISAAELAAFYDTQLTSWQAKYTSVPAPSSSRTHCVYWPDWVSNATVELERGIRMDANYYHYPGPWIGAKPGFMNGGGFPMRFADLNGTPVDVYQQNTNMTDESTTSFSDDDRRAARQRNRCAGLLRRVRREHAHGHRRPASGCGGNRLGSPGAKRAGCLVQAAARLGRRPQRLDDPGPQPERRHAHFCPDSRRGRERAPGDAARAGLVRDADRDHPRRLARRLLGADDQGRPVRPVHAATASYQATYS